MTMQRRIFPVELQKALVVKGMDGPGLSRAMHRRGYRLSKQFIYVLMQGGRRAPAETLRRICETLELSDDERKTLHRAACIDQGYEL